MKTSQYVTWPRWVVLYLLFSVGMVPATWAASLHAVDVNNVTNGGSGYETGWRFTITNPITVTELGKFVGGSPAASSEVAIYATGVGGARLAYATVTNSDPLEVSGSISARYVAITPVVLPAGTYEVYGKGNGESFVEAANTASFANLSTITWNAGIANAASGAALPATNPGFSITNPTPYRYFGATFKVLGDIHTPIGLTGWTQDVIAESAAANPAAGTTSDYYGGTSDFVWYEQGAPGSAQGLPTSGSFTSSYNTGTAFQFQPYTANNVVLHDGTVALSTPDQFQSLAFLVSAQGGSGATWNATLNFSDNTSTVLSTQADPDWTANGNNALNNMGLYVRDASWGGAPDYAGPLHMFEHDFALSPSDQLKTLVSINFNEISGNMALFAVSGISVVPEPTSLTFLGMASLAVLQLARRKRKRTC